MRYEIPLTSEPQTFSVDLAGQSYRLTLSYYGGWCIDLARGDSDDYTTLIKGMPLVGGIDLLGQYKHLEIGGSLFILSSPNPFQSPTENNLGTDSRLFFDDHT